MAKTPSLLEDVLSRATNRPPGFQTWFDRLPPEAQAELTVVREAFNPAIHQKRAYCRAVIAAAKDRGWQISGEQGVLRWLAAKR
jgi:hypothetical protein